jgi:hypothetical protein
MLLPNPYTACFRKGAALDASALYVVNFGSRRANIIWILVVFRWKEYSQLLCRNRKLDCSYLYARPKEEVQSSIVLRVSGCNGTAARCALILNLTGVAA